MMIACVINVRIFLSACLILTIWSAQAQYASTDSVFNVADLERHVRMLSHDSMLGRVAGTPQARATAAIISEAFAHARLEVFPGYLSYLQPVPITPLVSCSNVIGMLPGKSKADEVIIFSAHYDHVNRTMRKVTRGGTQPRKDTVFNGANDNASGVAGLIALMRYFAARRDNERTLIFAAFTAEEMGLIGSKVFVTSVNHSAVKAVINIDMIGRPVSNDKRPYIPGDFFSNLRSILNTTLHKADPSKYPRQYFGPDLFPKQNLFRRSDNVSFASKSIAAHTIIATSPYDDYYHTINDEIATIDFPMMSSLLRAIAIASTDLISGAATPKVSGYIPDFE
jgi:Zn-dependent M28 family amino/carboxypeptidase